MWSYMNLNFTKNLVYNEVMDSMGLWLGLAVLAFSMYILWGKKRSKLPPGPIGIPIFGYYFFLGKKPMKTVTELAKQYGNVFGLYIGPKYVLFLNDWEAAKDCLTQTSTLGRPPPLFEQVPFNFGVAGINGGEWVESRRLTSKALKDGLQRNSWEDLISKEVSDTMQLITQKGKNPIEVREFFRESFANNVISLIFGQRPEAGEPITKMVTRAVDFIMENLPALKMDNFSKVLNKFLTTLGLEKIPYFFENTREIFTLVSNTVDSSIHDSKSGRKESFISRFQDEFDKREKMTEKSYFTDGILKGTILALLTGGSETTRTSVIWALIAMAEHPDIQKKVHDELDEVLGKEGSIRWSDRSKVPYTLATLFESMRWRTTVPLNTMRMSVEDTQIQGYYIPKGTYILVNNWCVHNDPRYWKDPDQFIPERFLYDDGKKVNMAPDSYLPFSYGKRNCPGKMFALMNMLQYFSTVMQKFKVVPKEGDKVKFEEILGLSYQARNVELRFIPR